MGLLMNIPAQEPFLPAAVYAGSVPIKCRGWRVWGHPKRSSGGEALCEPREPQQDVSRGKNLGRTPEEAPFEELRHSE